jgi:hypothetical protein
VGEIAEEYVDVDGFDLAAEAVECQAVDAG